MNPGFHPARSVQLTRDGQRVSVRWQPLPDTPARLAHPHCLRLLWEMASASSGQPTAEEMAEISRVEAALVDELADQVVLSVAIVGKGYAELVFHTTSADDFVRHLEAQPRMHNPDALRVSHFYDPAWRHAERLLRFFDLPNH